MGAGGSSSSGGAKAGRQAAYLKYDLFKVQTPFLSLLSLFALARSLARSLALVCARALSYVVLPPQEKTEDLARETKRVNSELAELQQVEPLPLHPPPSLPLSVFLVVSLASLTLSLSLSLSLLQELRDKLEDMKNKQEELEDLTAQSFSKVKDLFYVCVSASLSLCISALCVSASLRLCVSVSLCLCVSVSLCLCVFVSLSGWSDR